MNLSKELLQKNVREAKKSLTDSEVVSNMEAHCWEVSRAGGEEAVFTGLSKEFSKVAIETFKSNGIDVERRKTTTISNPNSTLVFDSTLKATYNIKVSWTV